jgi:Protein of unknown function (DUF2934)
MDQGLMLRIRERAYHIWAANGGDADRNWFRAETEILHTSAAPPQETPLGESRKAEIRRKGKKHLR